MTAEAELTLAAARVARSCPEAWDRFIAAFQVYSSQQVTSCIQSTLDHLPVAQGRAQATARLYGLLADCVQGAGKIEGKRK